MSPGKNPSPADTAEYTGLGPGTQADGPGGIRVAVDCAALTDQGRARPANEDHYLVARFGRFLEPLLSNLPPGQEAAPLREGGFVLAVADGMGGAVGGAVASALALRTLVQLVCAT